MKNQPEPNTREANRPAADFGEAHAPPQVAEPLANGRTNASSLADAAPSHEDNQPTQAAAAPKKKIFTAKRVVLVLLALLVVAGVVAACIPLLQKLADPAVQAQFTAWVESLGAWGWLVVLGIQILQVFIAFIPGEPVELAAGVLYGGLGGLVICQLGILIATPLAFLLARRFGTPLLEKLFGKQKLGEFKFLQNTQKLKMVVFLLFLIPGTPKDMLTYVVGVTPIKLSQFLPIAMLARIPSIVSSTILGASVRSGQWVIAIVVFVLTALVGLIGIQYHQRIMAFCKRHSHRASKSQKHLPE